MKTHPNKFLWWLLGVSTMIGFGEAFVPDRGGTFGALALPHILLSSVILYGWCKAHVRASGLEEPTGSALLCGLFGIIGVPLYFFRAFGLKKGCIGTLKTVGFFVIVVGAYALANASGTYMANNNFLYPLAVLLRR